MLCYCTYYFLHCYSTQLTKDHYSKVLPNNCEKLLNAFSQGGSLSLQVERVFSGPELSCLWSSWSKLLSPLSARTWKPFCCFRLPLLTIKAQKKKSPSLSRCYGVLLYIPPVYNTVYFSGCFWFERKNRIWLYEGASIPSLPLKSFRYLHRWTLIGL